MNNKYLQLIMARYPKIISLLILFITCCSSNAVAQQISNNSLITESRIYWNPAYMAQDGQTVFGLNLRQQWLGFEGAPLNAFINIQKGFEDLNMAVGGLIYIDKTGPISKIGAHVNYNYSFVGMLNRYDKLTAGVSAQFNQYRFSDANLIYNDENDILVSNASSLNSFYMNAGAGLYYQTSTREYKENNFYFGLALSQLASGSVLINDNNQFRSTHFHFNIGTKVYSYDQFFEPYIMANIVNPDLIEVLYGVKYELRNAFWTGLGYASSGNLGIQGGVIFDEFNGSEGALRLGGLAAIGAGKGLVKAGPSFEIYIGYTIK